MLRLKVGDIIYMVPKNATDKTEIKQYPIEKMGKSESSEQEYYEINNGNIRVYESQHDVYNRHKENFFSTEASALRIVENNCIYMAADELNKIKKFELEIKNSEAKAFSLLSKAYEMSANKLVHPMYKYGYDCGAMTISDIINIYKTNMNSISDKLLIDFLFNLCHEDQVVFKKNN